MLDHEWIKIPEGEGMKGYLFHCIKEKAAKGYKEIGTTECPFCGMEFE